MLEDVVLPAEVVGKRTRYLLDGSKIMKDVVLITTRRIVRPPNKGSAVQRPRTHTLTAVHEAMLEDVVLPAEVVGKRIRYLLDGSKIMKVFSGSQGKKQHGVQAGELFCSLQEAFRKRCCV